MDEERRRFELDDDRGDAPEPDRPEPAPPAPRDEDPSELDVPAPIDESGVDTRTLAERTGTARERHRGRVPPPPDWPREAFLFPLRKPGPTNIAVGAAVMLALDAMGVGEAGRFPAWILKLVVFMFLLRGQLHVIARSADGRDDPTGWRGALQFDSDELRKYGGFMAFFALGVIPGWVLIALEYVKPGIAVLGIGSMYVSVVALGAALGDRSAKWPWNAIAWMVRHPISCLAGSAGWWVLGLSEVALTEVYDSGVVVTMIVAVPLRLLGMYTLALSARAIGVMGRNWKC